MSQKLFANMRIALHALRVNKMRSALTMLGIVIGVAAVIIMLAIGTGATRFIQEQIASMGSNMLLVMPGSQTSGGVRLGNGNAVTLTENDARAIGQDCPAVLACSPLQRGAAHVIYGANNWGTSIQGVWPDYLLIRGLQVIQGRVFTDEEVEMAAKVALLGQTVSSRWVAYQAK